MTYAHLRPLTLRRSLKQKTMARLKQFEIIVRRLVTLMALALTLPADRPQPCHDHTPSRGHPERHLPGPAPLRPLGPGAAGGPQSKRLARSLARQQKRGDPKPVALPMASACRLRPEPGMIAAALAGLLCAALEGWDNAS